MKNGRWNFLYCILALGLLATSTVQAGSFTVTVVDGNGDPVNGFRWLLQEDTTWHPTPGIPGDPDILAFNFHKSHHPLAKYLDTGLGVQGNVDTEVNVASSDTGVVDGHYYVSVLPYEGYSIGGAPVEITGGGNTEVMVTVQKHPIPTAQIAIYLFHDHSPINNAPDLPVEANPPVGDPGHVDWTQFSLFLEEPAGRYGIAGGQVIQDAFGNPLGTEYDRTCDENGTNTGSGGSYGCFDSEGVPIALTGPGGCPAQQDGSCADGTMHPNADGSLTVRNLVPGKYGVIMIPPTNSNWQQTNTIEGSKVIDAWVKAKEPPFFVEFGPPGPHVFVGFLRSNADGGFPDSPVGTGAARITGTVKDMHMSRPPASQFYSGRDFPDCWIGLNDMAPGVGVGVGIYAAPCNDDSEFTISGVPTGNYQLAVFDANMDVVWGTLPFTVDGSTCNGGGSCDLGEVPVFNWFARLNTAIFNDMNQNGFWDAEDAGIGPESQDVSLRWRDGTIYQNFPTDNEGFAPFDETFPFFNWLVAEVSFANKKATGVTYVVDAGGEVPADEGWNKPSFDELTPQPQCVDDGSGTGATVGYDPATQDCPTSDRDVNSFTGNHLSRTETGPSLTTGFQGFLGQTSVMQFGKADYLGFTPLPDLTYVGENGGISGIIYYATTRAENEPQFAAAEEWEPGVPRVQVNLYADGDIDSFPLGDFPDGVGDIDWNGNGELDGDDNIIDDVDGDGVVTFADVDNYPLGWADGGTKGTEDVDHNGDNIFDHGDALQVTWTDSWDDSLPTGCQGVTYVVFPDTATETATDCFDGLRNFNQIRPGVFDGGYAFTDYDMANLASENGNLPVAAKIEAFYDAVETAVEAAYGPTDGPTVVERLQLGLIPGDYIVESATPPGYEHIKEEDRNVDFGDEYIPGPGALPVACVGDQRTVAKYFSFLTMDGSGDEGQLIDAANIDDPGALAPFSQQQRPLCDRKKVPLSSGQNAAAEFFLMTDVPVAANVAGIILNDLANEFDPNAPTFGEKTAPAWSPVAFYDWNGAEVNRINADQFGAYNAVLPSTFTTNIGMPSGMSPNMLTACMNDAGPVPDGAGGLMVDPFHDPQYSQFCYNFQYMPGTITYLDTPVLPIAAFAGPGQFPVDCELPTQKPMISSVTVSNAVGGGPFGRPGNPITIKSKGPSEVLNPEWDGVSLQDKTIVRDYSFICGASPSANRAELERADGTRIEIRGDTSGAPISCSADQIVGVIPDVEPGDYQVVVTHANDSQSRVGVTLTVGDTASTGLRPGPNGTYNVHAVSPGGSIQAAINSAAAGDLILVPPGSYDELIIMWKPVKLQGWGSNEVFINARQSPTNKLQDWRDLARSLAPSPLGNGSISPLPGQEVGLPGFPGLDEAIFPTEEGAGIFVLGIDDPSDPAAFAKMRNRNARIDGFTILGASNGGGIIANGYNQYLNISNNRLTTNAGVYGGGIRIGHPGLSHEVAGTGDIIYDDAMNDNIRIHHNHIIKNGGLGGLAGGGIALNHGADNYKVERNWVCGNFAQGNGAGISHRGVSDGGLIEDNLILFNESFNQGQARSGGGVFIGGQAALMPAPGTGIPGLLLSPGTGNVTLDGNLIRGNLAGAGDGGGVSLAAVNGLDVNANPANMDEWYQVKLYNNMINNNVAGLAGGGLSLQDALSVEIIHNTVANNDSVATTADAFTVQLQPGDPGHPGIDRNITRPQPAGIVSREHSAAMASLMAGNTVVPDDGKVFSDPTLTSNIIHSNRSQYWLNSDDPATPEIEVGLYPSSCPREQAPTTPPTALCDLDNVAQYTDDVGVMNAIEVTDGQLKPTYSLFPFADTSVQVDPSNVIGDPSYANAYFNVGRGQTLLFDEFTTLQTAGAWDEGGNFIQVAYGPLSLLAPGDVPPGDNTNLFDYHLVLTPIPGDAANNAADVSGGLLAEDIDNQERPNLGYNDIGADEGSVIPPLELDTDEDGVADANDNCTLVANGPNTYGAGDPRIQRDTDGDGFGNICDTDINQPNDGVTNSLDIGVVKQKFLSADPDADFNGDGVVNSLDIGILRQFFLQPPGPAGELTP